MHEVGLLRPKPYIFSKQQSEIAGDFKFHKILHSNTICHILIKIRVISLLTHMLPMNPFSTSWKHGKTFKK